MVCDKQNNCRKPNDIRLFLKLQTLYQFKQMYTIAYNPSYFKLIIFLLLAIIYCAAIHQFIHYFFLHTTLITTFIILFTLLLIIKAVGLFVMFPGSYRYVAASIEKTQNDHLLNCIRRDMQSVQKISIKIIKSNLKLLQQKSYQLQSAYTLICIKTQLNVLKRSGRDEKEINELIETYTKLIFHLNKQYHFCEDDHNQDKSISISKIMMNPNILYSFQSEQTLQSLRYTGESVIFLSRKIWKLCQKISRIAEHPLQMQRILGTYKPQQNQVISIDKFQIANWHMYGDKLFTMNSYYGYWDDIFAYSRVLVPVTNGDFIQCVVIHGQKPKELKMQQQSKAFPKIAVLICNPNGAFLQGFALASSYMNFYIRWGFQIVLWNYRGYAQSTGIPSVSKCISDVQKVYHFVNEKFQVKIQVVHGYSIGGISAINLVHKINSQINQSIKLLVADRTFSSLDNVAQGFFRKQSLVSKFVRKISKPFVKTLFMSDCIDNSEKYIECKCYKVCIFDLKDEIISNTASLKYGIIDNALQAKRNTEQQPSSESERLVDLNYKQSTLLEEAESFSRAICHLFKMSNKIYQNVIKILADTDGGGQNIERRIYQIGEPRSQQNRIKEMRYTFRIYYTSLAIFGPKYCIPQYIDAKEQQKWVQNRLDKRIQLISSMVDQKKVETYDSEIRNIVKGLQYARNQLKSSQMIKNRNKYGNLIISDAGHNSQIKKQYYLLENTLKKSVFLQKKDSSKTKQDKQIFSR